MKSQLLFMAQGANVKRYHTVSTIQPETVGHHSHGVACLVLMLTDNVSVNLLTAALLHDLSEHQTGDIPAPAKREYGIGEQVSSLELTLLLGSGFGYPELSKIETRILKLADIAQGALYCAQEIAMGNKSMQVVFDRYMSYAHQYWLVNKEAELFNTIKEICDGNS